MNLTTIKNSLTTKIKMNLIIKTNNDYEVLF